MKIITRRKRDGVNHEVKFAPLIFDARENRLKRTRFFDIERHHDGGLQLFRERADKTLRLFIQPCYREFSTEGAQLGSAAEGD